MKTLIVILMSFISLVFGIPQVNAQSNDTVIHVVKTGDSMWKIAVKYQVGLSEIIKANSQVKNPSMIYPNQKLNIPQQTAVKSFEQQVFDLTNKERAKQGLPAFKIDWELQRTARYKSDDMRDKGYFSHQSPTYGSPFDMMKQFGISFRSAGENIASGQRDPSQVVTSWMNSQGHRENILNRNYTHLGVGYSTGGSMGTYWTQMFIQK
jgi:uncharacterized YkwD family protein/spore coat assembly protein SafA